MDGWTGGGMCEWMNAWMYGCMYVCTNEYMDGWTDECMNGWLNECMNVWMDSAYSAGTIPI